VTGRLPVGVVATWTAWDDQHLWLSATPLGKVVVLDLRSGKVWGTADVGGRPADGDVLDGVGWFPDRDSGDVVGVDATGTVVGIGGKEQQVAFTPLELFHFARNLRGCVYGSADPAVLMPRILEHAARGEIDLGALISGTVGLDGIDGAFADMEKGVGARAVVVPA
jgi:hypothetical protein